MKSHLLELVLCSGIGVYAIMRIATVLPGAMDEATRLLQAVTARWRSYDELLDGPEPDEC